MDNKLRDAEYQKEDVEMANSSQSLMEVRGR